MRRWRTVCSKAQYHILVGTKWWENIRYYLKGSLNHRIWSWYHWMDKGRIASSGSKNKEDVDSVWNRSSESRSRSNIFETSWMRMIFDWSRRILNNRHWRYGEISTEYHGGASTSVSENNAFGAIRCRKGKRDVLKEHEIANKVKTQHGKNRKGNDGISTSKSWDWLMKSVLKKETESTIIAAQNQTLCTNNV